MGYGRRAARAHHTVRERECAEGERALFVFGTVRCCAAQEGNGYQRILSELCREDGGDDNYEEIEGFF